MLGPDPRSHAEGDVFGQQLTAGALMKFSFAHMRGQSPVQENPGTELKLPFRTFACCHVVQAALRC